MPPPTPQFENPYPKLCSSISEVEMLETTRLIAGSRSFEIQTLSLFRVESAAMALRLQWLDLGQTQGQTH